MMLYDEINNEQVRERYYNGRTNKIVRLYWYLEQGLDILNKFRYLILFIMGLAVLLRVEQDLSWMLLVFVIAVPILTLAGYAWVKYGVRAIEYLNLKYATHFAQYNMKIQEDQLVTMKKLAEELDKLNAFNNRNN